MLYSVPQSRISNDEAACIIRNTKVSIVPFNEVSAKHAYKEGENDRTLENWREVHRRLFKPNYEERGLPFDEYGDCVLEEFEVVFRDIKIEKKEMVRSERLVLKPYSVDDRDKLVELFTNEEIVETFMVPDFEKMEQYYELADKVIAFSSPCDKEHLEYGIYLDNALIGTINDCGFDDETIEIGYLIHPDYWGKGYATEALSTIITQIADMGFSRIVAGYFEKNVASRRVMEKCGMTLIDKVNIEEYRGNRHTTYYCEKKLRQPKG